MAERPRVRLPKEARKGEVIVIKTLIQHDMETGLRKDPAGNTIPRRIINKFTCDFNGKPVFSADLEPAVAANPYLQFNARVRRKRDLPLQLVRRRRQRHHGGREDCRDMTRVALMPIVRRLPGRGDMQAVLTLALGMAVALPLMSAPAVAQPKGPAPMATGDAAGAAVGALRRLADARHRAVQHPCGDAGVAARPEGAAQARAPGHRRCVQRREARRRPHARRLVPACHVMGRAGDADLPGNVGPDLSEIGNGGRDDEWLWNYVYDARAYNPATVMPPWGTHRLFDDKEIGDIVAFLKTLKSPARFKTEVDDPAKRHAPVETRDNLDPTTNPAMWAVDKGEELYKRREASGFSCATCHGDAGPHFKSWAAAMPKWEPRFDKVIGIEEFVFRHAKATTGATWLMQSDENVAMAVYLRNVANGQEMTVDVASPGAKEAFERGRALAEVNRRAEFFLPRLPRSRARRPQMDPRAVARRAEGTARPLPDLAHKPQPDLGHPQTLQWCGVAIWANELPPDAKQYGDLELYLASVNAGQKLNVPGIRH